MPKTYRLTINSDSPEVDQFMQSTQKLLSNQWGATLDEE
jgi:hypothetical protein